MNRDEQTAEARKAWSRAAYFTRQVELLKAQLDGSAYGLGPKPTMDTTEVPTTMQFDRAALTRDLGLRATADESLIRARIRGLKATAEINASMPAAASSRPRLDAASIRASSDQELRSLSASALMGG